MEIPFYLIMKKIELTKDHKVKLLKMCKELFPEYKLIDIHKNGLFVLWEELPPSRKWFEIHWFEFCMTHLFLKVFPDTNGESFGKSCKISNSIKHYEYFELRPLSRNARDDRHHQLLQFLKILFPLDQA